MRTRWVSGIGVVALVGAALGMPAHAGAASTTPPANQWVSESSGGGHTSANLGESMISAANVSTLAARWQSPNGESFVAPAVVNGVVYRAIAPANANGHATFLASSVTTGARLWSVALPESQYFRGQSVSASIAVLPFDGYRTLGGVTAVDLATHKVLWSHTRPASTVNPGNDDGTTGGLVVDSGRAFLLSAVLTAFALNTGAVSWHRDVSTGVSGIAAGGGVLYTSATVGNAGPGLIAYDDSTGVKEWSAAGFDGQPVIAGSTVLAPYGQGVGAVAASGCGASACTPTWYRSLNDEPDNTLIGAATPSTFFVASEPTSSVTGQLTRINTTTGTVQWTSTTPHPLSEYPMRAGNLVWIQTDITTVTGWSATTTAQPPATTITLPAADNGVVGGLADAQGSLLIDILAGALTAYRLPGT